MQTETSSTRLRFLYKYHPKFVLFDQRKYSWGPYKDDPGYEIYIEYVDGQAKSRDYTVYSYI